MKNKFYQCVGIPPLSLFNGQDLAKKMPLGHPFAEDAHVLHFKVTNRNRALWNVPLVPQSERCALVVKSNNGQHTQ